MDGSDDEEEGAARLACKKFQHLRNEDLSSISSVQAAQLLREYGGLVPYLARFYPLPHTSFSPISQDDQLHVGQVVLLQSWVCFDPSRGMAFSSWASLQIRRAFFALQREAQGYTTTDLKKLQAGREIPRRPYEVPLSAGEGFDKDSAFDFVQSALIAEALCDNTNTEEFVDDRLRAKWLREALRRLLTPRELVLLSEHILGVVHAVSAVQFGLTRQRVDQIVQGAIRKLQWAAWDEGLLDDPEPAGGPPQLRLLGSLREVIPEITAELRAG
jgi:RNA polymerase sigma factor (sigma-70 family)